MRNGTQRPVRSPVFVIAVPVLTALCALGTTLALSRVLSNRERGLVAQRTDAEAKHVASQLRFALLRSVEVLPQIANRWLSQGPPESRHDWETDAQLLLKEEPSLREVVWLNTHGKAIWCVQPGRVPDFHCTPTEPDLLAAVEQARTSDAVALSRVELRQGVSRLYACNAVRRGQLVGFIAAAYDARELVGSVLRDQMPADYGLQIASGGYVLAQLKQPRITLWPEGARRAEVSIAHSRWSVELTPVTTDIQTLQRVVWSFGITVTILLSACTALALIYKRNESKLQVEVVERRKAEEDFRTLLEVMPVGIAISTDASCHDIWVNPALAEMLQMSMGQNISHSGPSAAQLPYKLLRGGVELPVSELPMQKAARTGKSELHMELDVVREDGSVLHTLSYSAPVFDENGKVRRVINACVDMTDRKRSEEQRKELEVRLARVEKYRSLGLMAGGIAHDFNNLLTGIIGHAELAKRDLPPFSKGAKAIEDSLTAAHRASELVGQLLAYTGQGWFDFQEIDLSAEVQGMAKRIRGMTPAQVQIDFELPGDLPPIHAGSREVYQVLRNLIANAIEAIGEDPGTIRVRTTSCVLEKEELARDYPDQDLAPGAYVRLEVQDSGGGVPSEVARNVFDPFFTTKFLGRGLGLSAVQGIMRAHRGGVRFDSSRDRGVCVQAIFPVKVKESVQGRVA